MDRGIKPVYVREKSGTLGGASDGQSSPPTASSRGVASPLMQPRHGRSGSIGKKPQNTKAAAQRLATMMSHQQTNDSEDDDDIILSDYYPPTTTTSATTGRSQIRPPSPMTVRTEQHSAPRAASVGRSSQPLTNHAEKIQSQSARSPFDRTSSSLQSFSSNATEEHVQPASARANRSSLLGHPVEQPSSARSVSVGRPSAVMKPVTMVPSSVSLSLRKTSSSGQGDSQTRNQKNKSIQLASYELSMTSRLIGLIQLFSALVKLSKLRIAEERCEESEVRARQLEKQAALRAAAAENASHNHAIRGGVIDALRLEAETAREEAASVREQLQETECEVRSLKTMTQRMVLTHEEMEELVLKRCWLARYWSLCVQHGIHAEIAGSRYEYWSSFAPLPVEVVISAGQKAKAENSMVNNDKEQREKIPKDAGEVSVENMLLVERGLREMTLLKIEDALAVAMAQQRRLNMCAGSMVEETKLPIKCQYAWEPYDRGCTSSCNGSAAKAEYVCWEHGMESELLLLSVYMNILTFSFLNNCSYLILFVGMTVEETKLPIKCQYAWEPYELSKQESDDVLFKQTLLQAWLICYWRRVKNHGLEPDIVDERLQFWINQGDSPTSHDAVDGTISLPHFLKIYFKENSF
ncbi:hypothetical protein CTI12_AA237080 [Artemisia annua]|uniref:Coiled-coil domain-containing protein SCD2 n=1 Tax=Artemisia annua TaxID=35608 RepID=A0A2U1NRG2_ARTAN|nr:hypothetical protein CTI12_AA237080 [Artemisia annua]